MASAADYKLKHSDKLIRENASTLEATRIQQLLHRRIDNSLNQITNVDIPGITSGSVDLAPYFKLVGRIGGQEARGGTISSDSLGLYDNHQSFLGNTSTGRITLVAGNVRVRHGASGNTGNIFEVTDTSVSATFFRTADDGQSSFTSSTTSGIVNIAGVAGGTSLSVGSSGTTTVINHVLGASDYNHRIVGTGAVTWRHNTAGNALAGTWDGNFTFQPPTGTTTTVPLTVKGRASQTGNLLNLQTSTPTTVASFLAGGALAIAPTSTADVILSLTPNASQTANVITCRNFANTHNDFSIDSGGLVTVCETTATDDAVRFQVRAPSTQASANILQVIRAYAGGNYTAWSMGFGGANVFGDSTAHGAGVIKLQLRQGSGQSVNMFEVVNTAGTASLFTIDKDGKVKDNEFTIADGTDNSKTLKFELGSSTASADITLDYRSVTDRSIIWNLTGASGTASPTFVWAGTTVARTITFPSTASFTVAGLQVSSQTFTRALTINPTAAGDSSALNITTDVTGSTPYSITVTDSGLGLTVLRHESGTGLAIQGGYQFYPDGIGVNFSGTFAAATLSASRIWTFPNFAGNVLIGGATTQGTGQTASVPTNNLVTAAANPSASTWMINAYLAVTTAEAGTGTISVTIGWTDVGGARTQQIAARTLTTLGATQGTLMIQSAASNAITYFTTYTPTAGGTTEAYAYYIQATKLG